jgi:nicotinamide phosphoribosyltransferase
LGLQAFLMKYLTQPVTMSDVEEASEFAKAHGEPFNYDGWKYIVDAHDGYLPLEIKAVPEGTLVPVSNILASVRNTDPRVPWLTSYIETALMRMWYPITVATRIFYMKKAIKPYFDETSETGDMGFAILDFASRGVSSYETSELGGLGHLVNFIGSDNVPAVRFAQKYYNAEMAAFSVPATEHSIMTAFGQENELASFEYLIENMMPEGGILSVVSDSWNIYEAIEKWISLADKIRAKNGTLVIRPDSGDIREVLERIIPVIMKGFGYDYNHKGFAVLRNVKILQGDGIREDTVADVFDVAAKAGLSADSIMTGSGGGLMSHNIDRDTCKFAFKASNVVINGISTPICKTPIGDPGKRSKSGKLALLKQDNEFQTVKVNGDANYVFDTLRTVYLNGRLQNLDTLDEIRARLNRYL